MYLIHREERRRMRGRKIGEERFIEVIVVSITLLVSGLKMTGPRFVALYGLGKGGNGQKGPDDG